MGFSDTLKVEVKRKAHYRCVICNNFCPLHVHHIVPTKDGGFDNIDNAVPFCPSCHTIYGGNPETRKWIHEKRDFWYEYCDNILKNDNILNLEKLENLIHKSTEKKDQRINDLENELTIVQNTLNGYTPKINSLINKFPESDVEEREILTNQIQSYSNIVAVSGHIMENYSRTGTYNLPHFIYDKNPQMYNLPDVSTHQISDNNDPHSGIGTKIRWPKDDNDSKNK